MGDGQVKIWQDITNDDYSLPSAISVQRRRIMRLFIGNDAAVHLQLYGLMLMYQHQQLNFTFQIINSSIPWSISHFLTWNPVHRPYQGFNMHLRDTGMQKWNCGEITSTNSWWGGETVHGFDVPPLPLEVTGFERCGSLLYKQFSWILWDLNLLT